MRPERLGCGSPAARAPRIGRAYGSEPHAASTTSAIGSKQRLAQFPVWIFYRGLLLRARRAASRARRASRDCQRGPFQPRAAIGEGKRRAPGARTCRALRSNRRAPVCVQSAHDGNAGRIGRMYERAPRGLSNLQRRVSVPTYLLSCGLGGAKDISIYSACALAVVAWTLNHGLAARPGHWMTQNAQP